MTSSVNTRFLKSHKYFHYICKRQISTMSSMKLYQRCNRRNIMKSHERTFVQAIKKIFHSDKELNDLEEQAYGCTENAQYTRALWGFEQLMQKDPDCARYYFDYGLTIVRYIDKPSMEMLEDSQKHFRKAIQLSPNEPRIIKTYGSLLTNALFGAAQPCFDEARQLFEGYYDRMIATNKDLNEVDTEILFLYGQLLDDKYRDYILAKDIFEKCIDIAAKQSFTNYEKIGEYRLRFGFFLYKQQEFDSAIKEFEKILKNFREQIDEYNQDPNQDKKIEDQIHYNNYLRRKKPNTLSHIFANMYLGVIYSDLSEYHRGLYYFEKMMLYKDKFYVKDDHSMQILMLNEYILFMIKIGNFEKAHEYWLEAYRLDKLLSVNKHSIMNYLGTNNFDVLTIGGHLFSEKGLTKKSQRYFKNLMKMVEEIPQQHLQKYGYQNPYYFYGLHCLKIGDYQIAKESFVILCKLHPQFPEFLYQLSVSCAKLKQYEESKKYLKQAMNMNFKMIYPKYFAQSDDIFKKIDIEIPDEKRKLLAIQ